MTERNLIVTPANSEIPARLSPFTHISDFCSALGLDEEVDSKAREILNTAIGEGYMLTHSPKTTAASVVYIASALCNQGRTQKDIKRATGVSSVNPCYQKIAEIYFENITDSRGNGDEGDRS